MEFKDLLNRPGFSKILEVLGDTIMKNEEDIKEYKDVVNLRMNALKSKEKNIAKAYQDYYQATYSNRSEKGIALKKVLFDGNDTMEAILAAGLKEFFYGLLPADMAEKHCQLVLRQQDYIYDHSSYRRSFRTRNPQAYFNALTNIMRSVYFNWYDFDLVAYLLMSDEEIKEKEIKRPDSFMVSQLMALEIDNKNTRVIEAVKEMILSENNTRIIDHTFVRGIAKSHDQELYNLMMQLLLAAKLQEGLRQVVLETADDGTIDYFCLVLKTILDNNLLRYSSCIRAVDVWMGLGYNYEDKRVLERILTLSNEYLKDAQARERALGSPDVIEMYCGMWAESVYSADKLRIYIEKYARGEKYQKLVAFYFLHQTNGYQEGTSLAAQYLDEEDLDVTAWVHMCYNPFVGWARDKKTFFENCKNNSVLAEKASREQQFASLAKTLVKIPKDGYIVSQKPFDWCHVVLQRDDVFRKMMVNDGYEETVEKTQQLIDFISYASSDQKIQLLNYFIMPERSEKERAFLFDSLSDKSMPVRVAAAKLIKEIKINEAERTRIENLLALKTGEIRQISLDIIKNEETAEILKSVERLITDKAANKRLGALDILKNLLDNEKITKEQAAAYVQMMPKITEQEQVLVNELEQENVAGYTLDNGFGLYKVEYRPEFPPSQPLKEYTLEKFRQETAEKCINVVKSLIMVIEAHKDYTFSQTRWDGSETETIFGHLKTLVVPSEHGFLRANEAGFDQLVLAEVWKDWMKKEQLSLMTLNRLRFAKNMGGYSGKYEITYEKWAAAIMEKAFGQDELQKIATFFKETDYGNLAADIIAHLARSFSEEETFAFNYGLLADFMSQREDGEWQKVISKETRRSYYSSNQSTELLLKDAKELNFFINELDRVRNGEAFEKKVALCYELGRLSGYQYIGLDEVEIAIAVTRGFLDINELYRTFFRQEPTRKMMNYTGSLRVKQKAHVEEYPVLKKVTDDVVQRVIDIEVKRGDTVTEVSHMAQAIRGHQGVQNFADILFALGTETLSRGYIYGGNYTKKEVLSSLLKASCPAPGEDAKALKAMIGKKISDKRLLEAAMYAPVWISVIEEYLGWKGLKSGAWYFHAHTSNGVSAEFETEVARFSPISKEDFRDGAFDIKWFQSAYKTLGEERFDILYKCAKYISDGAVHRRAQLFADAVLGKLDVAAAEEKIADKRNKDLLLSYSLIPLGRDKMKGALRRYEFIQNFLKESKKFGAQRRASEGKVAEIALGNLARNLGYDDTLRFSWKMEVLKLDEISCYFKPHTIEDCTLYIDVETTEIKVEKGGKALKSIPAKLKKDAYVEELKKTKSALSAQFKRAQASFEKAMENQDEFPFGEMLDLLAHPVIMPIITKLVFTAGEKVGFLDEKGLKLIDGTILPLKKNDTLTVAHCYHLYQSGEWREYQKYAFSNQLVQPFKQIFRELYLINEDEKKERTISRRYAGNQIQPKKTVALLKSRNWTVDYDNGLQKVYYKDNVIASMYALADWFSPGDVEAPTLETVEFRNRKDFKAVAFESLPPVIFSETMRDVDLVVSVAHVGGVDPLTSHSTIEMRGMIVEEIIKLLKHENVTVDGSHAKIIGKKGEYSVHLGSGIVHMMGKGALNILPVHSQHRGKLFLPFLDEDPKTAEILSKILLLAEDDKIKDATILAQII